jgi:hypothetical protein
MRILFATILIAAAGCGGEKQQPAFSDLHPVTGVVKRGGTPMKGGQIIFTADPADASFGCNSVVGADGTFTVTTYRTTDSSGERKPGAPAGKYAVSYIPDIGDQSAGGSMEPIKLAKPVAVNAGKNELTIELPPKR